MYKEIRMTNKNETSDEWHNSQISINYFICDSTRSTYKTCMRKVQKICDTILPLPVAIHDILLSPKKVAPHILTYDMPINSKHTLFVSILAYLNASGLKHNTKDLFHTWYTYFLELCQDIKHNLDNNIPSEKQERNMIEWPEVLKIRDSISPHGCIEHILVSMYTYLPPRRQLDYASMRIYTDPNFNPSLDHNHFHLYNKTRGAAYIYENMFKNVKYFKKYFNPEIPKTLLTLIKTSIKNNPRDYLFETRFGEPYTANNFQKFSNGILKRVFNNPEMTVNVLRHSFDTYLNQIPNITVGERQKNATKMGHSLKKALEYAFIVKEDKKKASPGECFKKNNITKKLEKIPCP